MAISERETVGTWRQVAAVIDGRQVPVGPGAVLTVGPAGYTITANGRVIQRGMSKADYDKTPHEADVTVTEGMNAGQAVKQIFTVAGDVLIACNGAPGGPRPTAFTSRPDSGATLSVWLRCGAEDAGPAPWASNWRFWVIMLFALSVTNGSDELRQDFIDNLGYWGGVLATGLFGAVIVTLVCVVLRWGWRQGVLTGVTLALAANTFTELRATLQPTLGAPGAIVVSAATAMVAALVVGLIASRLLRVPWGR